MSLQAHMVQSTLEGIDTNKDNFPKVESFIKSPVDFPTEARRNSRPRKSTLTQQQKNKKRQRAKPEQVIILKQEFAKNPTPSAKTREEIGRRIDMTERSVQIWFQNKRAKAKLAKKRMEIAENENRIPNCNDRADGSYVLGSAAVYSPDINQTADNSMGHPGATRPPSSAGGCQNDASIPRVPNPLEVPLEAVVNSRQILCPPVVLSCSAVCVGTWSRVLTPGFDDLDVRYFPSESILSYSVRANKTFFRIDIPLKSVEKIVLEVGEVDPLVGHVIIYLSQQNLSFWVNPSGKSGQLQGWRMTPDYTENQQASRIPVHKLTGIYLQLQSELAQIYSFQPLKFERNPLLMDKDRACATGAAAVATHVPNGSDISGMGRPPETNDRPGRKDLADQLFSELEMEAKNINSSANANEIVGERSMDVNEFFSKREWGIDSSEQIEFDNDSGESDSLMESNSRSISKTRSLSTVYSLDPTLLTPISSNGWDEMANIFFEPSGPELCALEGTFDPLYIDKDRKEFLLENPRNCHMPNAKENIEDISMELEGPQQSGTSGASRSSGDPRGPVKPMDVQGPVELAGTVNTVTSMDQINGHPVVCVESPDAIPIDEMGQLAPSSIIGHLRTPRSEANAITPMPVNESAESGERHISEVPVDFVPQISGDSLPKEQDIDTSNLTHKPDSFTDVDNIFEDLSVSPTAYGVLDG
uniref:ARAD1B23320p n=1 Tax=Blastobotrys adeninivorans TaxID=409370 RepID=A0A060T7F0_BLAAD